MTTPEKLIALIDTILVNPFSKSASYDEDGNISYTYTVNAFGEASIPCATTVTGKVWYLFDFLASALNNLVIWRSNVVYRKYQIVRYGLNDYIALSPTAALPTDTLFWALIRENVQGLPGEGGVGLAILTN